MHIAEINATDSGAVISVEIAATDFPQNTAGVVWRYKPDKSASGSAGLFSTESPEITLGILGEISGEFYLIEGAVLHHNDDPPTPYKVEVTVKQNDQILHNEIPPERGSGQVGKENAPFFFRFTVEGP